MAKGILQGGIAVEMFRGYTEDTELQQMALPSLAVLTLDQYPGAQAQWKIAVGDRVAEDQLVADGLRAQDVPLHSPIPGIVEEIRQKALPDGGSTSEAFIRLDGQFTRTGRPAYRQDWEKSPGESLLQKIWEKGVVLDSSSIDPVRNVLDISLPLKNLVINGIQNEPYLTASVFAQKTRSEEISTAIRILQKIFQPDRTFFTADPDDPDEWKSLYQPLVKNTTLVALPQRYPQAQEQILFQTLVSLDFLPASSTLRRSESLTISVDTLLGIYEAVVYDRPCVEKLVVLSGAGIPNPGVYQVRIGTPISRLLAEAGGLGERTQTVLMGGPFQGGPIVDWDTPVTKSTQAILALTASEVNLSPTFPCIRCSACVSACPRGLNPVELYQVLAGGLSQSAWEEGLGRCVGCGLCSFVCPSRLPLWGTFAKFKGEQHGK